MPIVFEIIADKIRKKTSANLKTDYGRIPWYNGLILNIVSVLESAFILNLDEHWVTGLGLKPGRVKAPVIHSTWIQIGG